MPEKDAAALPLSFSLVSGTTPSLPPPNSLSQSSFLNFVSKGSPVPTGRPPEPPAAKIGASIA